MGSEAAGQERAPFRPSGNAGLAPRRSFGGRILPHRQQGAPWKTVSQSICQLDGRRTSAKRTHEVPSQGSQGMCGRPHSGPSWSGQPSLVSGRETRCLWHRPIARGELLGHLQP